MSRKPEFHFGARGPLHPEDTAWGYRYRLPAFSGVFP